MPNGTSRLSYRGQPQSRRAKSLAIDDGAGLEADISRFSGRQLRESSGLGYVLSEGNLVDASNLFIVLSSAMELRSRCEKCRASSFLWDSAIARVPLVEFVSAVAQTLTI